MALWNGADGGLSKRINSSDQVYAFMRQKDSDKFIGVFNLSNKPQTTKLEVPIEAMKLVFDGKEVNLAKGDEISLAPWEYFLFSNK